ncbi:hypothetical protein DS2_15594 [Catenovulum agarivorans DS-2]|uniref:Tricarboxylate transport protein TctC n=1 Tax=Catenovulum agarivorans DS-2 TaxID=1328313 RepID=W7QTR8_9ALTE|nr:tripartite tricarboxylate transporter substrate binding protein [Catenovulum agarivorans]EWH08825.1 hypothetical protein DS2_15594 [Catenovulum agarivorans DS-2]
MNNSSKKYTNAITLMLICGVIISILVGVKTISTDADSYPRRPLTNVVVWSAGGGTDVANRIISAELAKALGADINVTNKPGGVAGSLGLSYVNQRRSDGYTLVGLSESCVTAAVMGGWAERMDTWYPFIIGGSPDLISVSANSPFTSVEQLVEYALANPNKVKAAAAGSGSLHHLNLLAFAKGTQAEFKFVPYPGSAPSQTAVVTEEVDIVITSMAEQQQLIKSGQLRPLAMLTNEAFSADDIGDIPTALDVYPALKQHLPITQVIGFAVNADTPDSIKIKLTQAFNQAMQSDKVKQWADDNYFVLSGKSGAQASEVFSKLESLFGWTLEELGAAKHSPAKFGINQINAQG